jgi:hypothetical protein
MRMRIELKLRLIHERMLAPEASKNRRLRRWVRLGDRVIVKGLLV